LANALPNNLIFLLDVSGSMELPERLPLLKEAVNYLVKQMRPIDKISIVTYSGEAKIVLPSISASENEVVSKSLKKLKSKGESNALAGLQLAYEELSRNFIENGNNRIVIATDGGIQVNKTLLELTKENALNRKYISVFYFGNKEVRHKLQLESLAKSGFGNYVRITPENIQEKLIEEANSN
jgi:Ca-activated chloride channel family protein